MIIGTVRAEEARAFDDHAGYHEFHIEPDNSYDPHGGTYGSFEVFFYHGGEPGAEIGEPGWYWHACHPGCLPDGEATGPFATSAQAMYDADEWHPDNMEDDEIEAAEA